VNPSLFWALKKVDYYNENPGDALENVSKASESDVWPLSIYFSKQSISRSKITRFIVFLALFIFLVPFDLYVTSTDYRVYYYGTAYRSERVRFSEDVTKTNNTF
jgi:flagellar biosynthesis/type III secretory pathway M-ring protein FliF/YscJ